VASDKLRKVQDGFKADLRKAVDNFKNEARLFKKDFDLNGPMFSYITPDEGIVRMKKFQKLYEAKAKKIATFQQGEELFGLPKTTYPQFEVARGDLALMSSLYSLYTSCMQSVNGYLNMSMQKLSVTLTSIAEDIQGASKKIAALSPKVEHYMAYKEMQQSVKDLADIMPLLEVLTNPAMRPRHWQEVMVITQTVLNISSPTFSLSELLSADLLAHRAGIEGVCKAAQAELSCEEEVEEIGKRWQDETLSFANFKALGPVTLDVPLTRAMMESIEDSLVTLHTLLVSRASVSCRDPIKDLVQRLSAVQDLLEVWLGVQHIWCYVRIVFSAEDIHKQLPQEAKRFENVNKNYMSMMHDAFGHRF
jgi:dynein heavy chain